MYLFNIKEIKKKLHLKLDSFFGIDHHDSKKKNEQSTQKQNEQEQEVRPIEITVIDIKKTLEQNMIQCITKPMKELNYIAISYRWGELLEHIVPTTHYKSHVTSFAIQDFYRLCQLLQKENDVQQIPYVWIDTISIDQQNVIERKKTIHNMDQIYEQAAYIVAVPDLHYAYLTSNSANQDFFQLVKKHSTYMYHSMMLAYYEDRHPNDTTMIQFHQQQLNDIEIKWMYHWLTSYQTNQFFSTDDDDDDVNILSSFQPNGYNDDNGDQQQQQQQAMINMIATGIDFTTLIHLPQIPWHDFLQSTDTFTSNEDQQSIYNNIGRQYLNSIFGNDVMDDVLEQQLSKRSLHVEQRKLLKGLQLQQCKQLSKQYEKELQKAYDFLQYLVNEWSNRAWVISEYHIAKKKISTPMKLVFLSMDWQAIIEDHEKNNQRPLFFWNFFGKNTLHNNNEEEEEEETLLPATKSSDDYFKASIISPLYTNYQWLQKKQHKKYSWRIMGKLLWKKLNDRLGNRECLDMILNSMATKNQDRYFAILPLWKKYYNRVITHQIMMTWEITDMISVRLNLFEWMDLDDKVCLLHACSTSSLLTLPSFVTYYDQNGLVINELYEPSTKNQAKLMPTLKTQPILLKTRLGTSSSSLPLPSSYTSYSQMIPQLESAIRMDDDDDNGDDDDDDDDDDSNLVPFQLKMSAKKISYSQYNNNNNTTSTPKNKNKQHDPILSVPYSKSHTPIPVSAPISTSPPLSPVPESLPSQHKESGIVESQPIEMITPNDDDDDDDRIIPNIMDIILDKTNKSIPKLLLKVKKYYKNENEKIISTFYDKWSLMLFQHGFQWEKNELRLVTIPLFIPASQKKPLSFSTSYNHLSLIGHPIQNKWVLYRYDYYQGDIDVFQYQAGFTGPYDTKSDDSFFIY